MHGLLDDPSAEEFAWDPSGRRIAYHSRRDGEWRIWLLTVVTHAYRGRLTFLPHLSGRMDVSPFRRTNVDRPAPRRASRRFRRIASRLEGDARPARPAPARRAVRRGVRRPAARRLRRLTDLADRHHDHARRNDHDDDHHAAIDHDATCSKIPKKPPDRIRGWIERADRADVNVASCEATSDPALPA